MNKTEAPKAVNRLLKKADKLREKVRTLGQEIDRLWEEAANICPHPKDDIRQFKNYGPPWVICLACGYAEEMWGIGGWHLPSNGYIDQMPIPRITDNEGYKRRRFFRTQDQIVHEKIHVPHHGQPADRTLCQGSGCLGG